MDRKNVCKQIDVVRFFDETFKMISFYFHFPNQPTKIVFLRIFVSHLYSIRTRLVLLLTFVITIVYALFTLIEVQHKTAQVEAELHGQISIMLAIQTDALSVPLWNFDRDEIQRQLSLFVANRDIDSASVIQLGSAEFEAVIARAGRSDLDRHEDGDDTNKASSVEGREKHLLEQPISFGDEKIGHLIVEFSDERINIIRDEIFSTHIKQFFFVAIAIALTVVIAVNGLIRPILNITQAMSQVAEGDLDVVIPATERRDEIGKMAQALTIFKANAVQLQVALDKERELNGLQRQFVSMVSHEFRTPLAIIDGVAQRALRRLETLKPDAVRESQQKVRLAVVRLTELMESVLSAARLEEGRIAFEPKACSLTGLIAEIHDSYCALNKDKEIFLDIQNLPTEIIADGKLLRQIVSNLLSNAIKYSPDGKRVWLTGHLDQQNELVIAIRDEGVGIPKAELDKLFQRFFRASTSTGIAGSGIGLNLVQNFIELHGGRIDVDSETGVGSTFTVRIPFIDPANTKLEDAA